MNAAAEMLINLGALDKVFYTEEVETHALSDIEIGIKAGEFVSIAGPSGSGKTTLLSILDGRVVEDDVLADQELVHHVVAEESFS